MRTERLSVKVFDVVTSRTHPLQTFPIDIHTNHIVASSAESIVSPFGEILLRPRQSVCTTTDVQHIRPSS